MGKGKNWVDRNRSKIRQNRESLRARRAFSRRRMNWLENWPFVSLTSATCTVRWTTPLERSWMLASLVFWWSKIILYCSICFFSPYYGWSLHFWWTKAVYSLILAFSGAPSNRSLYCCCWAEWKMAGQGSNADGASQKSALKYKATAIYSS